MFLSGGTAAQFILLCPITTLYNNAVLLQRGTECFLLSSFSVCHFPFINNMLQLGTVMLVKLKNCFPFGIQGSARKHEELEHVTLFNKKKLKGCSLGLAPNLPFNERCICLLLHTHYSLLWWCPCNTCGEPTAREEGTLQ